MREPICCDGACANEGRDCPLALDATRLALGLRALHTEDGGTWVTSGHRVLRLHPMQEPQPAPPARRPFFTPERIGAVIGAAAGLVAALVTAVRMNVF